MHLGMAIQTTACQQECVGLAARQTCGVKGEAGMAGLGMTGLAQKWWAANQQGWIHGTVRHMAKAAVLGHRRMLPQERPALLRMTGVAGVVDGAGDQQIRVQGVMWRMT